MPKFDNYKMPLAGLLTTIAVITLGIVDLVMVLTKGTGGSVSNFLINAGVRSPTVVFMVGIYGIQCTKASQSQILRYLPRSSSPPNPFIGSNQRMTKLL